jgi:tRNA(Arg) A34 adenosine deaminase TadA
MILEQNEFYMTKASELANKSIEKGGGPFGCVIVKDGEIVGEGHNHVRILNDPILHAEVVAIQNACRNLGTHDLSGCVIYTSCEPCPMCLGAIYWARISKIFYGNTRKDAAAIGFSDDFIYDELAKPLDERIIECNECGRDLCQQEFVKWREMTEKAEY